MPVSVPTGIICNFFLGRVYSEPNLLVLVVNYVHSKYDLINSLAAFTSWSGFCCLQLRVFINVEIELRSARRPQPSRNQKSAGESLVS
jgi:hypothetical protein